MERFEITIQELDKVALKKACENGDLEKILSIIRRPRSEEDMANLVCSNHWTVIRFVWETKNNELLEAIRVNSPSEALDSIIDQSHWRLIECGGLTWDMIDPIVFDDRDVMN